MAVVSDDIYWQSMSASIPELAEPNAKTDGSAMLREHPVRFPLPVLERVL